MCEGFFFSYIISSIRNELFSSWKHFLTTGYMLQICTLVWVCVCVCVVWLDLKERDLVFLVQLVTFWQQISSYNNHIIRSIVCFFYYSLLVFQNKTTSLKAAYVYFDCNNNKYSTLVKRHIERFIYSSFT